MNEQQSSGFLLIDKPAGMTSHDVVDRLRRITGIRKIGHAGTLDPFATGLLILAIGRSATKRIQEFVKLDKVYEATFVIGATTETLDTESEIEIDEHFKAPSQEQVEQTVKTFIGKQKQIPPKYSAIKKNGKKMYELARAGKEIEIEPRDIEIFDFQLIGEMHKTDIGLKIPVSIHVSSGTYIRSVAFDLGNKLGTTGYVNRLRRISIGDHHVKDAYQLDKLSSENWIDALMQG